MIQPQGRPRRGHDLHTKAHVREDKIFGLKITEGNFAANSAWLVAAAMAYNLTRAAGVLAEGRCAKARTGTIRRRIINVPARISSSARRQRLHLPQDWAWQGEWENLFTATHKPPQAA